MEYFGHSNVERVVIYYISLKKQNSSQKDKGQRNNWHFDIILKRNKPWKDI